MAISRPRLAARSGSPRDSNDGILAWPSGREQDWLDWLMLPSVRRVSRFRAGPCQWRKLAACLGQR